jgi:hypothetical protein
LEWWVGFYGVLFGNEPLSFLKGLHEVLLRVSKEVFGGGLRKVIDFSVGPYWCWMLRMWRV